MTATRLALLLLLCPAVVASHPARAQVFVAPAGDDAGPGSLRRPFATPARAQQAVRALRAEAPERGVVVLLRGGTYRLEAPLAFGPEDGGDEERAVLWSSYPGERAVLSGGREVRSWEPLDGGLRRAVIPEGVAGGAPMRGLFLEGERLPRARHPSSGWLRVAEVGEDRRTAFRFEDAALPRIDDPAGMEVLLLHDWSTSRIPLAALDLEGGWLRTSAPIGCAAPHYAIDNFEPHPRFALEGHRALLDAPGEWHLDARTGELLLFGLRAGRVEYPVLPELLRVMGDAQEPVRNLHFRGIDFELCRFVPPRDGWAGAQASMHERRDGSERAAERTFVPAAVHLERALESSFEDCGFRRLDGSAVWIGSGCRAVALRGCEVRDVGANGVNVGEDGARRVGGQPWWRSTQGDPEEVTREVTIERCLIERCGELYAGAVGIWIGFAADCTVRSNELRELPYTGLSVGWVWAPDPSPCRGHRIERNHIHHVMQQLSDGACIYTLGLQPGTVIRANHLHDVPRHAGRAPSNGIFMDEGTTEVLVEGNLIAEIGHSPIRFHRAGRNTIRANLLDPPDGLPPFFYNACEPAQIDRVDNLVGAQIEPDARARIEQGAAR